MNGFCQSFTEFSGPLCLANRWPMLRTQMMIVRRLFKYDPFNTIELQQQIAQKLLETGNYVTA